MAESERYLPLLIDKVEAMCEENGLRNDSIIMRMTGCPNGCARPYVAGKFFPATDIPQMLTPSSRGRFRWKSSRYILYAVRRWILRSTIEQDLQRYKFLRLPPTTLN